MDDQRDYGDETGDRYKPHCEERAAFFGRDQRVPAKRWILTPEDRRFLRSLRVKAE